MDDPPAAPPAEGPEQTSAAQLAGILTSAMDAIISVDAAQQIVLLTPAAERMLGWAAAEIRGQPLDRLLPPRLRARHRHHIADFGATGVTARAMGQLEALSGLRR